MIWDYIKLDAVSREELDAVYAALHPSRKEHIDSLKKENSRLCSLAGELLAKRMLKENFGIENAILQRDEMGKPFIKDSDIHISISHCDQTVVCAAHGAPVGIDIERIRPVTPALIKRVCTQQEQTYLNSAAGEEEMLLRFFEVWTAKEAYFKKQGTGITDLKSVNILNLNRQMIRFEDYVIQTVI